MQKPWRVLHFSFFLRGGRTDSFPGWTRMLICIIHMEALSQSESSITEKHEWLTAGKQATGGNRLETEVDVREEKRERERMDEGVIMYETQVAWLTNTHQVTICLPCSCVAYFGSKTKNDDKKKTLCYSGKDRSSRTSEELLRRALFNQRAFFQTIIWWALALPH